MRPVVALAALTVLLSSRPSAAREDKPATSIRKLLKRKKVPDVASLTINSGPAELSDAGVTSPFWFLVAEASDGKGDKVATSYYAAYDSSSRRAYYISKWGFPAFVKATGVLKDPKKLSAVQLASAWWVLGYGTAPSWKGEPKLTTEADGTLVLTARTAPPQRRVEYTIRISPKGKISVKSRRE